MFADDFEDSKESLQKLINVAQRYCNMWRLIANESKGAAIKILQKVHGSLVLPHVTSPLIYPILYRRPVLKKKKNEG